MIFRFDWYSDFIDIPIIDSNPRYDYLVSGLEPWNFMTFHSTVKNYHPNWRSHIFQRGGSTTNQDSVYRIIWNYSTRSGDYNNPRTGNPVLNQPVYWNDSRILNTAQLVKGRQTCRLTIGYKTTIARVDEGYIYKMGPPR